MNGILVGVLVILLSILILYYFTKNPQESFETNTEKKLSSLVNLHDGIALEKAKSGIPESKMYFYNYLAKPISITVNVTHSNGLEYNSPVEFIKSIPPGKSVGVPVEIAEKYFKKMNIIRVETYPYGVGAEDSLTHPKRELISRFLPNIPRGTLFKKFHFGMITSRWVGEHSADIQSGQPGGNAVQGMPYVYVHNLSEKSLNLNNQNIIKPGETFVYKGIDHLGVRLGEILIDHDGNFKDFELNIPCTDIYYGVNSDVQQSLFGGFQTTAPLDVMSTQPQFLLEEGWMGGPSTQKIDPEFLPRDGGDEFKNLNEWGEKKKGY